MYNEKQKLEFIEFKKRDNDDSEAKGGGYFNRTEVIERYLEKDACDFTYVEIINYFKSVSTPSTQFLIVIKNYLEQYTRWCLQNGFVKDGQNHYEEVTTDILRDICTNSHTLKKRIISKSALMDTINDITRPCDKFLVLAIFEGLGNVRYADFWYLTMDDFDGEYVQLKKQQRKLKVSPELIELAKISSETYEDIGSFNDFKASDNRIIKARSNTKDIESPAQLYRRIWLQLDRLTKQFGIFMSAKGLKESGRIDMLKNLRINNESIAETYRRNKEDIEKRYGKVQSIPAWIEEYNWAFE